LPADGPSEKYVEDVAVGVVGAGRPLSIELFDQLRLYRQKDSQSGPPMERLERKTSTPLQLAINKCQVGKNSVYD
jgi:hypothetical protein